MTVAAASVNDPDRGQLSATRRAGHPPEPQPRSARTVKLLVVLGIVAVLAILELRLGVLADAGRLLSVARVEAWLDRAGVLAPIVYMLVMAGLFFLLPVLIERYNLFSLRKYFTHDQHPAEAVPEPRPE